MRREVNRPVLWAIATVLAVSVALGSAAPAMAVWATGGIGSANGAASVMPTGNAPAGSAVGSSVTVSWSPATFLNGVPVAGYVVTRSNAVTGSTGTVGSGCAGIVVTTSCTEASVPSGTWIYSDTPVQMTWTGGQSAGSAPILVPLT